MTKSSEEPQVKTKVAQAAEGLRSAIATIKALADQQAMPDDFYLSEIVSLERLADELEKSKAVEVWMQKRIDFIERHIALTPRSTPNSIASGGRLTAYREILGYIRTH